MFQISEVESSDLITEGAPIPPEPPIGHWRPEQHVSRQLQSVSSWVEITELLNLIFTNKILQKN